MLWKVGQILHGELRFLGSFKNIVLKNDFQIFHFSLIFITFLYWIFSVSRFSNVIQALADEKTTHIPFRNSVLTRLLQESLGGNCKTSLVVSDIIFYFFSVLLFFSITEILGIMSRRRLKPTVLQLMNTFFWLVNILCGITLSICCFCFYVCYLSNQMRDFAFAGHATASITFIER